jgi:hypothetical protein
MKNKIYLAIAGMFVLATMSSFAQPSFSVQPVEQEKVTPGRDPSMQRVETSFPAGDRMKFLRLSLTRTAPAP